MNTRFLVLPRNAPERFPGLDDIASEINHEVIIDRRGGREPVEQDRRSVVAPLVLNLQKLERSSLPVPEPVEPGAEVIMLHAPRIENL